jgi:hypothetical protein
MMTRRLTAQLTAMSVVIDNYLLVRLTQAVEDNRMEGFTGELLDTPSFQPIRDNQMLRHKLMSAACADVEVAEIAKVIATYEGWQWRLHRRMNPYKRLVARYRELCARRDNLTKPYEMLRRLVCMDNESLIVHPTRAHLVDPGLSPQRG